jgi:hypothetical protein
MAYFSNGSEGALLDEQCSRCKYGALPCPIYFVQTEYNYDAVKNEVASEILNYLVKNDGTCTMFEMAKKDFEITE